MKEEKLTMRELCEKNPKALAIFDFYWKFQFFYNAVIDGEVYQFSNHGNSDDIYRVNLSNEMTLENLAKEMSFSDEQD